MAIDGTLPTTLIVATGIFFLVTIVLYAAAFPE